MNVKGRRAILKHAGATDNCSAGSCIYNDRLMTHSVLLCMLCSLFSYCKIRYFTKPLGVLPANPVVHRTFLCGRLLNLPCLALLCAALVSCNSHPDPKPLAPLESEDSVLVLGDSLVWNGGTSVLQSFPNRLSSLTRHRFINAGIPRAASADLLQLLPILLERFHPRLLLLCAGMTDMQMGLSLDRTEWNLRQIVKIALQEGVSVALVAVPGHRYFFKRPAPMYHRIAGEYGLWIEDKALKEILYNPKLVNERHHLNGEGNRIFAEELAAFLERAGALTVTGVAEKEE